LTKPKTLVCAFQYLIGKMPKTVVEPAKAVARRAALRMPAFAMRQFQIPLQQKDQQKNADAYPRQDQHQCPARTVGVALMEK
jgi:hypothetical protein